MGYIIEEDKPWVAGGWQGGDPNSLDYNLFDLFIKEKNIKTMIDVGCGEGLTLQHFLKRGIKSIGVDGSIKTINMSPVKNYIIYHDYTEGPLVFDREFDCCLSIEFLEHVEQKYMQNYLSTMVKSKYLFLTAGRPGQEGFHHVLLMEPEWWINIFQNLGYKYDEEYTNYLKSKTQAIHLRNNLLFFEQSEKLYEN